MIQVAEAALVRRCHKKKKKSDFNKTFSAFCSEKNLFKKKKKLKKILSPEWTLSMFMPKALWEVLE